MSPIRAIEFWHDESGSELTEYALVLTFFALVSIIAMQAIATRGNSRVETNETNYANAFVNGY